MTDSAPTPETLRQKHEAQWDPEEPYGPLALRTYRAISWIRAARGQGADNPDVTFILYWIAFNAAYAKDLSKKLAEDEFVDYFERLLLLDHCTIRLAIQRHFPEVICRFLENEYAFKVYWKHQNGEVEDAVWEHEFAEEWKRLEKALQRHTRKNTTTVLTTLFGRLYTLRNQLVHGGATWKGSLNRKSVGDGARIMEILVPIFVEIMVDNPKEDWGLPHYLARPNLRLGKREEEPASRDLSAGGV